MLIGAVNFILREPAHAQQNAIGGAQEDEAGKMTTRVMSKITAEDFSAARVKILKGALENPARIVNQLKPFVQGIYEFVVRVERAPPSQGYEPLFVRLGDDPFVVRVLARMTVDLTPNMLTNATVLMRLKHVNHDKGKIFSIEHKLSRKVDAIFN